MPTWNSYKAEAQARGSLAFELFVVITTPAAGPDAVKANLPDHLEYQKALEKQGLLALAGPMSDETGTQMQGTGLIIYRAGSFDDAYRLAEADPMHLSGARTYVLRRWMINEGSLTLNVGLSAQSVTLG